MYKSFLILLCCWFSSSALAVTLKIATLSPDGTSWMKLMREGAKQVQSETQGRVKIKFYPGGVMGSDDAVLRKIRLGQLHGAALPTGALHSFAPNLKLYNIPGLFHTFEEVDLVRNQLDQRMYSEIEKGGFVSLGFAEGGFAFIMGQDSIASLSEIQQRRVWIPDGDAFLSDVVENFGVSPVPLGIGDVLASLQTGMIDTVATSPTAAIALQWHTQVKYIMDFPVLYFLGTMVIQERAARRLKGDDLETVKRVMRAQFERLDKLNRKDNLAAYKALQQMGLTLQALGEDESKAWRDKANGLSQALLEDDKVSNALFEQIQTTLQQSRD